jgi:hypothetical protein
MLPPEQNYPILPLGLEAIGYTRLIKVLHTEHVYFIMLCTANKLIVPGAVPVSVGLTSVLQHGEVCFSTMLPKGGAHAVKNGDIY